jgi:hypothetical protein
VGLFIDSKQKNGFYYLNETELTMGDKDNLLCGK